jgi:hypothetical protein
MHPLPDNFPLNFTRASTFDIVQEVRCEVKAGLDRFKNSRYQKHIKQIILATSIGYDFRFDMTEKNDATGGKVQLLGISASGATPREVDLTGSVERSRENIRTFRFVEDLADVERADCSVEALRANLAYPIAGRLHVDDIAYTYVRLETITNFGVSGFGVEGDASTAQGLPKRNGVFSEHLEFNTKLTGGATPTLTLSVAAGSFGLKSATVAGDVTRNDQHSLIIAFAQDPNFHNVEVKRALDERTAVLSPYVIDGVQKKIVRSPRLETALAQANAVSRNRVLLELARLRFLKDDEHEAPKFLGERLLTFLRPPDETGPGD